MTGLPAAGHHRHGLLMTVCSLPILALAVVLLATGVVGPYFLLFAVGCVAMMAVMMRGMHGMNGAEKAKPQHREHDDPS